VLQQRARVLVVDDDPVIREFLQTGLRYEHFEVLEAEDGDSALRLAGSFQPDVVVLDLMMPGADGFEVCRRLRGRPDVGIIMLTAREALADRTRGLDTGADDYIVKPFHFEELLSRIRSVLRRLDRPQFATLQYGALSMDEARHEVMVDGRHIDLTPREYDLLRFLLRHPHQVLGRQTIIDRVWGPRFLGSEGNVNVCIVGLRSKLGPQARELIQTVRGVGFRLSNRG
jgi:DNA-binding response OmpR family regulator